jgi:ferredoxin-NADP reductase
MKKFNQLSMLNRIDSLLGKITMYRVVLYYTVFLLAVALVRSLFGGMPFAPLALILSTVILVAVCWAFNQVFAAVFRAHTNMESVYITALILALIIDPAPMAQLTSNFGFLFWAGAWAMASKYIVSVRNKHLFNPVAFAVALTSLTLGQSASWWVGSPAMLPFVLIGGFLLVRKVQRTESALALMAVSILASIAFTYSKTPILSTVSNALLISPMVFFVAAMFTEPLTMPPTRNLQIAYGALVGLLFTPQFHLGSLNFTPEMALLVGNLFTFIVSPKGRTILTLKEKVEAGAGIYDFVFEPDRTFPYKPGQFMEWTLGHEHPDNRGNRRYLTVASSPTETNIRMGVKFYDKPSSFKTKLLSMKAGDTLTASQLAGDFVLPEDTSKKLVLVAGGIGVTPFRSMLKYLIDKNEKRSVAVLYSCQTVDEIAYRDILAQAEKKLGANIIVTLTKKDKCPPNWKGCVGYISAEMVAERIPDFKERTFYISGPHSMVSATEGVLKKLGLPNSQIKTDFFPGLA